MSQFTASISSATTPVVAWKPAPRLDTSKMPVLDVNDLSSSVLMQTLGKALTMRRAHGDATEARFVAWLVNRLPVTMIDAAGNIHCDQRREPANRTMFTSHTDTVHSSGGVNTVHVDGDFWRASEGSALGADDGAGIALMCHMIERGVAGYYIFFRGEECGGIGSKWLSDNMPDVFKSIDHAVAFDRAGYYDVITHQAGGRCCSDEFALALADEVSSDTDWYMPDATGVYTDTAEFIYQVPECTNLSVGYARQHGDREEQDVKFLQGLAERLVQVNWDLLPTVRSTEMPKRAQHNYGGMNGGGYRALPNAEGCRYDLFTERGAPGWADDADEQEAIYALEWAMDGQPTDLMEMIAIAVYPDDPSLALRNMSKVRLSESVLGDAIGKIESGLGIDEVLIGLYDICTPA